MPFANFLNDEIAKDLKPALLTISVMPIKTINGEEKEFSIQESQEWTYHIIDGAKRVEALLKLGYQFGQVSIYQKRNQLDLLMLRFELNESTRMIEPIKYQDKLFTAAMIYRYDKVY